MAQNEAKDVPKRLQEAPKRPQKVISNRKTKKGPNQDDPKTVLDRQGVDYHQLSGAPGAPFGRPKRHQNRSQNDKKSKRKFKTKKRRPKTILDPSWSDLGSILAPSWGQFGSKLTPRWGQDRHKIAPRRVQDRLGSYFFMLNFRFDF